MKTKTETILIYLKIVAWVTYIGAIITGVAVITPLFLSFFPVKLDFDYFKLNQSMQQLKESSLLIYIFVASLIIAQTIIGINVWERVKNILEEVRINNPFKASVAFGVEKLSFTLLSYAIINIAGEMYVKFVEKRFDIGGLDRFEPGFNVLMGAAIIYVLAQIFKRGIEIQQENELTV